MPSPEDPTPIPITVADFKEIARRRLDKPVWDYYNAGADSETTINRNEEIYKEFVFMAEVQLSSAPSLTLTQGFIATSSSEKCLQRKHSDNNIRKTLRYPNSCCSHCISETGERKGGDRRSSGMPFSRNQLHPLYQCNDNHGRCHRSPASPRR